MQKKLKNVKDGAEFRLSNRKGSALYKLQRKAKGIGYFTSVTSERTFKKPLTVLVFITG